jgi:hypothetical protein
MSNHDNLKLQLHGIYRKNKLTPLYIGLNLSVSGKMRGTPVLNQITLNKIKLKKNPEFTVKIFPFFLNH